MLTDLLPRALVSAALASLTTVSLAAALSRASGRHAAEAINAVGSHLAGAGAAHHGELSVRSTLPGVLINFGGCLFWAAVVETWVQEAPIRSTPDALARGGLAAALAYVVDYHALPRRLRPGYERKLSTPQLLQVYASLAAALPFRAWWEWHSLRRIRRAASATSAVDPCACCRHANRLTLRPRPRGRASTRQA
jgi:hypothetical protein